jgi:transcriptional regulator with XRE-family HTH domain
MPYVEKLKMIKEEKDLTNAEIAKLCDLPLATITRVFSERTLNPTFETITRIAIGMGVSLDELVGLKQPDEPPIAAPIETTLNSYSELLKEKDERIKELKLEKRTILGILVGVFTFILVFLAIDLFIGGFGHFRY